MQENLPSPQTSQRKIKLIIGAVALVLISGAVGYALRDIWPQLFVRTTLCEGEGCKDSPAISGSTTDSSRTKFVKAANEISWIEPQKMENLGLMRQGPIGPNNETAYLAEADYYKVGNFVDGIYKGGELILVYAGCEEICFGPSLYRFVSKDGVFTLLDNHSESLSYSPLDTKKFAIDRLYEIPSLNFPEKLAGPVDRQMLNKDGAVPVLFETGNLRKVFTDSNFGDVYTSVASSRPEEARGGTYLFYENGFYLKAPDGTTVTYSYAPDFFNPENIPQITWNGGIENTELYSYESRTGCGSADFAAVVANNLDADRDLEPAGTNSRGDTIYVLKDSSHAILKALYETAYFPDVSSIISYDNFLQAHPLFFWRDPFGRLIKFENLRFVPPAECGKPVIYLYPQVPTNVSVKLAPQGGFSYTEPEYGNGWLVRAEPNGNLTELKSGRNYPYLFWEGRGGIYQTPDKGFVVARNEVHNFLIEKLAKLGLNKKETADFLEFWEPRMQSAPYYFVTFLGTRAMDQIAPIIINPAPDTIIRILMDFAPLNAPMQVQEPLIRTPERKGFTVVEWGGVLRK